MDWCLYDTDLRCERVKCDALGLRFDLDLRDILFIHLDVLSNYYIYFRGRQ